MLDLFVELSTAEGPATEDVLPRFDVRNQFSRAPLRLNAQSGETIARDGQPSVNSGRLDRFCGMFSIPRDHE